MKILVFGQSWFFFSIVSKIYEDILIRLANKCLFLCGRIGFLITALIDLNLTIHLTVPSGMCYNHDHHMKNANLVLMIRELEQLI